MDKSTLSQYGWVIICIIVIAILLGLATPFGNFVYNSVMNTANSFGQKITESLGVNVPGGSNNSDDPNNPGNSDNPSNPSNPSNPENGNEDIDTLPSKDELGTEIIWWDISETKGIDNVKMTYYESGALYIEGNGRMEPFVFTHLYDLNKVAQDIVATVPDQEGWVEGSYTYKINEDATIVAVLMEGECIVSFFDAVTGNELGYDYDIEAILFNPDFIKYSPTTLVIDDGVENVSMYAFTYFTPLITAHLPSSVKMIELGAFGYCVNLNKIVIPQGIEELHEGAFMCSGIEKLELPDSITFMGEDVFRECPNLSSVTIGKGLTEISSEAFCGCSSLTSISTEDTNVTSIGSQAFADCASLKSVIIGEKLTYIDNEVFSDCTNLTSVKWNAKSVADVDYYDVVFYKAGTAGDGIEFVFGDSVEVIPDNLCHTYSADKNDQETAPKIISIIIGKNVKSIGDNAFRYCKYITSITIPNSVEYIGAYAFSGCTGLKSVYIPESVLSIDNYAFKNLAANSTIYCESQAVAILLMADTHYTAANTIVVVDASKFA